MAKVRVEWVRLSAPGFGSGAQSNDLAAVISAQVLTVGATPVQTAAAPSFPSPSGGDPTIGFARVSGLLGAVNIAWGGSAPAAETSGVRLEAGGQVLIEVITGQTLSLIEAVDPPPVKGVQDAAGEATLVSILAALTSGLQVTGPLTAAQLSTAGLSTASNQGAANTSLAGILTALQSAVSVTGPLTNAQLAAAGLSTAANQGTANASLASILAALQGTLDVVAHPLRVEATNRSSTIAAAATAQDLMAANAARKGWRVQNQSAGDLYVRSKGAAGSTLATADQNSFKIEAGATWTEDAHVSLYALSIIGAAAGQAFFAEEW